MTSAPLFVGTSNRVSAIDRNTGVQMWSVTLSDKLFRLGSSFVNLEYDGKSLFAATLGELYCLDPATGAVRWKTALQGGRTYPVTFAGSSTGNIEAASAAEMDNSPA